MVNASSATFIFFVSEEMAEEAILLPHIQVGSIIKDPKELSIDAMNEYVEQT